MVDLGIVLEAILTGAAGAVFIVFTRAAFRAHMFGHDLASIFLTIIAAFGAVATAWTISRDGWYVGSVGLLMAVLMSVAVIKSVASHASRQ